MAQEISLNHREGHSFDENWLPHRSATNIWQVQGLFWERHIPQAACAFRMSVHRVAAGINAFTAIAMSIDDLLHSRSYAGRWSFNSLNNEAGGLFIDEDSIIYQEKVHILLADPALALRLREGEAGLDMRMERAQAEVCHDKLGEPLVIGPPKRRRGALHYCLLPRLKCGGHFYLPDGSVRVEGRAMAERLWGRVPLRRADSHWERFCLYFEDGNQVLLTEFPYAGGHFALILPADLSQPKPVAADFRLEAIDFIEVEEWRFAAGWRLTMEELPHHTVYLIPLIKEQYSLPTPRPVLGLFDKNGNHLGYALSELLAGARNELDKISLKMYT